jgi:hypothetical protein
MRQTELHLTEADRAAIDGIRTKGPQPSREVNRARVLAGNSSEPRAASVAWAT